MADVEPPLKGVRVVELTHTILGPSCGMILADLGAEVIKVERPGVGDDTRLWGPPFTTRADGSRGDAAYFLCANRNKKSIAIDITSEDGVALRGITVHAMRGAVLDGFDDGGRRLEIHVRDPTRDDIRIGILVPLGAVGPGAFRTAVKIESHSLRRTLD